MGGGEFSQLCIYAPADPTLRRKFFSCTLKDHLEKYPLEDKSFIGEDFNFVKNPALDRASRCHGGTSGLAEWVEATKALQLNDLFRNFHPKWKNFTFNSAAHRMQTRIDRCYASVTSVPFSKSCRHVPLPTIILDHLAGVEVTIRAINSASTGPSYWKFNTSLMKDLVLTKL